MAGLFVVFVFIATRTQPEVLNHVVINEVCTNNNAIFIDADNDGNMESLVVQKSKFLNNVFYNINILLIYVYYSSKLNFYFIKNI